MFYTYLLKLSNNKYYAGHSNNLKNRVNNHINGKTTITKNFRPLNLVFYAAFTKEILAIKFEKYLTSSSGFAFLNKRLI